MDCPRLILDYEKAIKIKKEKEIKKVLDSEKHSSGYEIRAGTSTGGEKVPRKGNKRTSLVIPNEKLNIKIEKSKATETKVVMTRVCHHPPFFSRLFNVDR